MSSPSPPGLTSDHGPLWHATPANRRLLGIASVGEATGHTVLSVMSRGSMWITRRRILAMAAVVFVAVAVAVCLLWPLTDLIAAHDVGPVAGPARAASLQSAREAARTQLLTLGAGVFADGALIFTARNFALSRQTLKLTVQGQVTERYTRAVEQLGSDKLDVRVGGIYALERACSLTTRILPERISALT